MHRRFRPNDDKIKNTAAVAPAMPVARRKRLPATPDPARSDSTEPETEDFLGIPPLALKLILVNCVFWVVALVIVMGRQLSPLHLLMTVFLLVVALILWLLLQYFISKAFWWFVVLYSSFISIALIAAFVNSVMDAMDRVARN